MTPLAQMKHSCTAGTTKSVNAAHCGEAVSLLDYQSSLLAKVLGPGASCPFKIKRVNSKISMILSKHSQCKVRGKSHHHKKAKCHSSPNFIPKNTVSLLILTSTFLYAKGDVKRGFAALDFFDTYFANEHQRSSTLTPPPLWSDRLLATYHFCLGSSVSTEMLRIPY